MQINIGILGLGTVGSGTVEVLRRNAALISERSGCDLRVEAHRDAHARQSALDRSGALNSCRAMSSEYSTTPKFTSWPN
jgi:homoserine dehydrogenase